MTIEIAYYVFVAACILGVVYELIPDHAIKFWRYRYEQKRKRVDSPEANRPSA